MTLRPTRAPRLVFCIEATLLASFAALTLLGCQNNADTKSKAGDSANTSSQTAASTSAGATTDRPAANDLENLECPVGTLPNFNTRQCDVCGGSKRCEAAIADCKEDGNFCLDEGLVFAKNANGLVDDLVRSSGLFRAACEQGNLKACNNLGVHLERGFGVAVDLDAALEHYKKSCTEDTRDGCVNLAALLEKRGQLASAHQIYEQECQSDVPPACYNLAISLERSPPGVRDLERARKLYEKACGLKHAGACNNLGAMLARLGGIEKDKELLVVARTSYQQGCELGQPAACRNLGAMAEKGEGGPRDLSTARSSYDTACRAGDINACARFALFDARGLAGEVNIERAVKLSMLACSNAEMLGCTTLGSLDQQGKSEAKAGLFAAKNELVRRCEAKRADACDTLGALAQRGIGQERDVTGAFAYYRQACDYGSKLACARLEKMPGAKKN
jgi:TPR repeat protein